MTKKAFRIAPEIKEQIITPIKNEGVSVATVAKEHGAVIPLSSKGTWN